MYRPNVSDWLGAASVMDRFIKVLNFLAQLNNNLICVSNLK
jgi:hypothetical protein